MRKHLIGVLLLLLLSSAARLQTRNQPVDAKIDKVTVFLQGAQVERSARLIVNPGKTELIFRNISRSINQQSIQVKATGQLTVLSVNHQLNYLRQIEVREEIQTIDQQKNAVQEKLAAERNQLAVFNQEESLLLKNQTIKGEQSTLKAAELKDAADFQRLRLTEVYTRKSEIDKSIRKLEAEIDKLNRQLSALNEKKDLSTSDIIVSVSAKETVNASFNLSYMVNNAGWFPTYDIRVKDIASPINLFYKANINQSSCEDWKEVKLALSTGNPQENNNKPTVQPWYLRYISYTEPTTNGVSVLGSGPNTAYGKVMNKEGVPLPGVSVVIKGTRQGTTTDANGFFRIGIPGGNQTLSISSIGMMPVETKALNGYMTIQLQEDTKQLSEVVVTGYSKSREDFNDDKDRNIQVKKNETSISTTTLYQPTTTVYEIEEPYTIPNDGKQYTVEINEYEIAAQYQYYAAPKLSQNAFLTAKLHHWQELNLLPGEANLFLEGSFLGKSVLDTYNADDTLELSLGMDKGVIVRRTMVKEFSQKKFLNTNKIDSRKFEIVVRNNKQQPINITIEDQFPISTTKEIEVFDKENPDGKLNSETQQISWQFAVEARKEAKTSYSYSVKYPKDRRLQLD